MATTAARRWAVEGGRPLGYIENTAQRLGPAYFGLRGPRSDGRSQPARSDFVMVQDAHRGGLREIWPGVAARRSAGFNRIHPLPADIGVGGDDAATSPEVRLNGGALVLTAPARRSTKRCKWNELVGQALTRPPCPGITDGLPVQSQTPDELAACSIGGCRRARWMSGMRRTSSPG